MRDAFGGILNLVLIAIFLVIIEGVLGMIVNYSKAFRMKNIVISTIEQYEGAGCFGTKDSDCKAKIEEGAKSIGYSPSELNCSNKYTKVNNLFCYKRTVSSSQKNYYYSIVTQVDINIPIINKIMGLSFFQVSGDTRGIKK